MGDALKPLRQRIANKFLNKLYLNQKVCYRPVHFSYYRTPPHENEDEYIKTVYRRIESVLRNDIGLVSFSVRKNYIPYESIRVRFEFMNGDGKIYAILRDIDFMLLKIVIYEDLYWGSLINTWISERCDSIIGVN
jgi:hypothetical protein